LLVKATEKNSPTAFCPDNIQLGYFQVIAEPVSTCVQEIREFFPEQRPRLVTKLYIPPTPFSSPEYQFCTVEYLIVALSNATNSTTAACNWLLLNCGAVQPSK
jgi:hypothetical protein